MPEIARGVLNVFPERSFKAAPTSGRLTFIYPHRERKSKIVEDLIFYDTVYIRTEDFGELTWLCTWLPFEVMRELLKKRAIVFLLDTWSMDILLGKVDWYISSHGSLESFSETVYYKEPTIQLLKFLRACKTSLIMGTPVSFAEDNPLGCYSKKEAIRIVELTEESLICINEKIARQAKESAEADFLDRPLVASLLKGFVDQTSFRVENTIVKANLYLAIMTELKNIYLHAPQSIEETIVHKLNWLGEALQLGSEAQQNLSTLLRVLDVPNISTLYQNSIINSENLMYYRDSAKEFRHWLHNVIDAEDSVTRTDEKVLKAYLRSVEKVSRVNRIPVKVLRFLVASGAGFLPVIGNITSIGLSAFDTFFLEQLIEGWKPKMFLDKLRRAGRKE